MNRKLSTNLIKLVSLLNDNQYHDGSTLGVTLDMTRSAVWKTIKKLQAYGVQIDSVKGKGYAMPEPLILLDPRKIKTALPTRNIDLQVFESLDSTNDYLRQIKQSKTVKICMAEQQTQGKGRLHRAWYSPFGKNIYFSCWYPFHKDVSELAGLSLVVSLAVWRALKYYIVSDDLCVKWPNDILYSKKKLSGSLIEIQAETHGASHAVIGIGVNVNMLTDQRQITQDWTSMQKITGKYIDRNEFSTRLIQYLLAHLENFDSHGFEYFIADWVNADCLTNQTIELKNLDSKIKGKVVGVNNQGHLLLQLPDGKTRAFSSGDTSIQK